MPAVDLTFREIKGDYIVNITKILYKEGTVLNGEPALYYHRPYRAVQRTAGGWSSL
jgi:hypothetical protein